MIKDIGVVIVARDEERMLPRCLRSVHGYAEVVVVVDDRTADKTAEVARSYGARTKTARFIDYSQIKNLALSEIRAPWTLLLDADEAVTPELRQELESLTPGQKVGFWIPFKNYLGQKWLRYGGMYPDYHLRLFATGKMQYRGAVHETLQYQGETGYLKNPIEHLTYADTQALFRKVARYAPLEGREKTKSIFKAFLFAGKRFIGVYINRLGVLDGWAGLVHAIALAYYQYLVYAPERRAS